MTSVPSALALVSSERRGLLKDKSLFALHLPLRIVWEENLKLFFSYSDKLLKQIYKLPLKYQQFKYSLKY